MKRVSLFWLKQYCKRELGNISLNALDGAGSYTLKLAFGVLRRFSGSFKTSFLAFFGPRVAG